MLVFPAVILVSCSPVPRPLPPAFTSCFFRPPPPLCGVPVLDCIFSARKDSCFGKMSAAAQAMLLLMLLLLKQAMADDSGSPMDRKEKEALYAVVAGFAGAAWNGSGLYPDPCGWTPIQGVSCDLYDGQWYPTAITIGPVLDNSLQCATDGAAFSPHLFDLTHLRGLTLYSCFTFGGRPTNIPISGWDKLSGTLETLEFRSNPGLTGPIPVGIGALAQLQSLVIADNALVGDLPLCLGNLSSLRSLVISGNGRISGPVPRNLGALSSLLKLDLSSNSLQGSIPAELRQLRSLTLLDLRNNSLSNGLGPALQEMASLQDLLLSNNPVGGGLSDVNWAKLPNLITLDLSNAGLSGPIPESMTELKKLRYLALDHNSLTGSVPARLQELPNLAALYLNGNNLTGRLEFTVEFYEKMGRRFASWSNPGLCYSAGGELRGSKPPVGVAECKEDAPSSSDGGDKDAGSRSSQPLASVASSSSRTSISTTLTISACVIVQKLQLFFV